MRETRPEELLGRNTPAPNDCAKE